MSKPKELDFNEKLVTTLAVIGGLIILAISLTRCQIYGNLLGAEGETDTSEYEVVDALSSDISELEKQLQHNLERSDAEIATLREQYATSQSQVAALAAENKDLQKQLRFNSGSKKVTVVAEAEAPAVVAPAATAAAAIGALSQADFDAIKTKLTQKVSDYDALLAQLNAKTTEFDALKASIATSGNSSDKLAADFKTLESANVDLKTKVDSLQSALTEQKKQFTALTEKHKREVKTLTAGNSTADWKQKLSALKVKHEQEKAQTAAKYNGTISELRNALRAVKTKTVFAESTDDLAPAAQSLIKSLEGYEGADVSDLNALYGKLGKKGNARKLVVNFASGISGVSEDYQAQIKDLLAKGAANSYYVAVGYADMSGSAVKNAKLSSKRATNVAATIKPLLKKNQFTQAFYLGQTDRFGEKAKNRVVEIWEITE